MPMGGLSTEQAPPLSIPVSFFLTAPLALAAGGVILLVYGHQALSSSWSGPTLALLHLGTLGFLGSIILGALYQMIPVLCGTAVPAIRLAHATHASFVAGVGVLVAGFASPAPLAFRVALALLACSFTAFLLPVGTALIRSQAKEMRVHGIRLAVFALALLATSGLFMAFRRATSGYTTYWTSLRLAHGGIGLLCFVGMLIAAVSFQVIPMFYLTDQWNRTHRRLLVLATTLSLLAAPVIFLAGFNTTAIILGLIPAAVACWLWHPAAALKLLLSRRRRRRDTSLWFFSAGLASGPICFLLGASNLLSPAAVKLHILFVFLAVMGWAGMIMHGMLSRIVPFLVWFHNYADLAGKAQVPSVRRLLPDPVIRRGFLLHSVVLLLGFPAILFDADSLSRLLGAALLCMGLHLAHMLITPLRFQMA